MQTDAMSAAELTGALTAHFGYDTFRPGQEAVVRSVLSGRPTIAILPTGGGKSLCFQLPALLLEGTTIVASPLVALMKDQVDALNARGIPATFINSSLSPAEQQERQAAIRRGTWRLVYVAPERFRSSSFLAALAGVKVPLLAIDEAHCISSWGHDFRPEYQKLAQARSLISAERVLALTATATPEVRDDIARALQLKDPRIFVAGFDRPNLFIEVAQVKGDKDKLGLLVGLARRGGAGLVYAATRKNVEKVVGALRMNGVAAAGYHAGMEDRERTNVQDRFLRGEVPVVVATNAFGMGVDKPDIRFVAHFDIPRSLEAYYQEIGRAGRDGNESLALLCFNFADVLMQRRMIEGGRPSRELLSSIWQAARELGQGNSEQLAARTGVHPGEAQSAVRLLESAGHLERGRGRGDFSVRTPGVRQEDLAIDFEQLEARVAREKQMLERLVRFADVSSCRRQNLLKYFGDVEVPRGCSACDVCKGHRAPRVPDEEMAGSGGARRPRTSAPVSAEALEGVDGKVYEALRALRTELAREQKVPPYVVFHDATLRELSRELPSSEPGFLAIKGAGPSRWQRYGARVLDVIAHARPKSGSEIAAQPEAVPPLVRKSEGEPAPQPRPTQVRELAITYSPSPQPRPTQMRELANTYSPSPSQRRPAAGQWLKPPLPEGRPQRAPEAQPRWVDEGPPLPEEPWQAPTQTLGAEALWELCESGASLQQIAAHTGQELSEVASHLAEGRRAGRKLDVARLLGTDRLAAIRSAARDAKGDLVAIRRKLTFPAALAEIQLALS